MKNIFKTLGLMLVAGSLLLFSCDPENNTGSNTDGKCTVTIQANNSEWGIVTAEPAGAVEPGTKVTLTATANDGYSFINWTCPDGSMATDNPMEVTVNNNVVYVANFMPVENLTYTITVGANDPAMGSVTKTPDSNVYHAGTVVELTAVPAAGYKFVNWSGANNTTTNPLQITVSGNATYTAVFEALPPLQYGATFDGVALDIAGYRDFQTNGEGLWLAQFARQAEGTQVWFPYLIMWLQGGTASTFAISEQMGAIELYKDTYYTAGESQYGDWQYYATESMNCTALDMTTLTVSFTGSYTMYDLGEIANETHDDPADCTHKTLSVNISNATFALATKAGFHKMNVK